MRPLRHRATRQAESGWSAAPRDIPRAIENGRPSMSCHFLLRRADKINLRPVAPQGHAITLSPVIPGSGVASCPAVYARVLRALWNVCATAVLSHITRVEQAGALLM
jgi:hypothetical protein